MEDVGYKQFLPYNKRKIPIADLIATELPRMADQLPSQGRIARQRLQNVQYNPLVTVVYKMAVDEAGNQTK